MIKKRKAIIGFRNILSLLIIMLMLFFVIKLAYALPSLPTEFYGRVRDHNNNVSAGSTIQAYDSNGVLCGSFVVVNSGFYGSLTCVGDDPETPDAEGAISGELISLRLNDKFTTMQGDNSWTPGTFKYVNLTYPVVFCGDYFCDAEYESYYTCPQDCPDTNQTANQTINGTANVTNGTGDGGSGGGGGGGGGGTAPQDDDREENPSSYISKYGDLNVTGQEGAIGDCKENWVCSNWSECDINGFQNRTCVDTNNCNSVEDKPPDIQKCLYKPTCFDNVRNGLEEGVDCGGLCPPCITCYDGVENCHDGLCEEGIDCGGPCKPCPTCFDGIKNCHDGFCEEGIDCGGPCEGKCPEIEIPRSLFLCKKDINPLSNDGIFFFILILLLILADLFYSLDKIKKVKLDKNLKDIPRIKAIMSIKRRLYLFIIITVSMSIILYLYYYFFIMCETDYKFIWLLLLLLVALPVTIHEMIRYLEYTEKKKLKKFEDLLSMHYKQIDNLIIMENDNLIEVEQELADSIHNLLAKREKGENIEDMEPLNEVYKTLIFLYSKYKERENPIEQERLLCDQLFKFTKDPNYASLVKGDPDIKGIIDKMNLLYQQYIEKQKLYDELVEINESKTQLKEDTSVSAPESKPEGSKLDKEDKQKKEKDGD